MTKSQRVTLSTATVLAALAALTLGGCAEAATSSTGGAPALVVYGSGGPASGASLQASTLTSRSS